MKAQKKEMIEKQTKDTGVANLKDDLSAEEADTDDGRRKHGDGSDNSDDKESDDGSEAEREYMREVERDKERKRNEERNVAAEVE